MPIEARSRSPLFGQPRPPVPPKEEVRPVVPEVRIILQEAPVSRLGKGPAAAARICLSDISEQRSREESEIAKRTVILTFAEENILQKAQINIRKDIDGINPRTILEAARSSVGTTPNGLYHNRQGHTTHTHLWDWVETVIINVAAIKRSNTVVERDHTQVQNLLDHLKAVENILLNWQFEEPEKPARTGDIFHQALREAIASVKGALHDPSNLIDTRLPEEIEVLRRLTNAEKYYRQHIERIQAASQ